MFFFLWTKEKTTNLSSKRQWPELANICFLTSHYFVVLA